MTTTLHPVPQAVTAELPTAYEAPTRTAPKHLDSTQRKHWADWFTHRLPAGRIVAIDVARFVALIGMVVAHTALTVNPDGSPTWWTELSAGRASALFATLAGVSLALMTGGQEPQRGAVARRSYVGLAVRALIVFVIGVALAWRNPMILVILPVYATLFWLVIPFLRFRARTLLMIGGTWAIVGPALLFLAFRNSLAIGGASGNIDFTMLWHHPGQTVAAIFLSGMYPGLVWFAYMLVGAGIGRCDLRSWKPAAWMVGVGAVLTAVAKAASRLAPAEFAAEDKILEQYVPKGDDFATMSPTQLEAIQGEIFRAMYSDPLTLLGVTPHTATIGDVVNTLGSALLVIGLCLLLVRAGFRYWSVLFGAGAMTLTLYIAHIHLANTRWGTFGEHPLLWNLALVVVVGVLFGLLRWSGPVEKLVAIIAKRAGRLVSVPNPGLRPIDPVD